jgi:hypothetical protein
LNPGILDPYWQLERQVLLSGDLGYIKNERLRKIQSDIAEVERMLKGLIKSLANKHLNPFRPSESAEAENPRILVATGDSLRRDPFLPINWEKNHISYAYN